MGLRDAAGVVHVDGNIGLGAAEINGHAHGAFAIGDGLHAVGYLLFLPLELALELRDKRVGVLAVQLGEGPARNHRDARGNQSHGDEQREREYDKKFRAKRHGASPSSHTSASGQPSPGAGAFQSRTRALKPYTWGSHTSGTTR